MLNGMAAARPTARAARRHLDAEAGKSAPGAALSGISSLVISSFSAGSEVSGAAGAAGSVAAMGGPLAAVEEAGADESGGEVFLVTESEVCASVSLRGC